MKYPLCLFLILSALLFTSCNKRDKVVAQVYYHKLYESEVAEMMPNGLSPADSLTLVQEIIKNWITEELILHEAEHTLSIREKNFDRQLEDYRKNLLINAYYDKLLSDADLFDISESDLNNFMKSFDSRYTIEKEIIKVNYVKLHKDSKLIEPVKSILFDPDRRVTEKEALAQMLGDSVEYLIDDEAWLYLDDIQNEVSFDISKEEIDQRSCIEKEVGDNHYLLVILDFKSQRSVSETDEEKASAQMMLLNQRKQQFLQDHLEQLYQKALKERVITQ